MASAERPVFSHVIKEHFNVATGRDLQAALERFALSPDTLDAIEDVVRRRAESPAVPVDPQQPACRQGARRLHRFVLNVEQPNA